nr:sigma-70 family RNA polymerase sigma factor [Myxococcota bacterium]
MAEPFMTAASSGSAAGPSDEEAIRQTLAGEPDAFRVLVERYQGRIYRRALRVLKNEEAARDATQDAFLKAFNSLSKFKGRSSFYTWLYRLTTNHCLDLLRRDRGPAVEWTEGGALEQEQSEDATPEVAGVAFAPAASVMRKQLREKIAAAIDR